MKATVLIIEDEIELAELITMYLEREGIDTVMAVSAEDAEDHLASQHVDLITLDLNLPGKDGYEFLQELRRHSDIPVMILSAREADEDIVLGLGIGADAFVTKPFAPRVLVARIRAMLRRQLQPSLERTLITFFDYQLDTEAYLLKYQGERINLSTKEFEVLAYLAQQAGRAISNEELYEAVWGNRYGDVAAIGVYIQRLRKKIEIDPKQPQIIETVFGRGYRLNT